MIVYKITDKTNGKVYIGQTTRSLKKRWDEHCKLNLCPLIHAAILKHGVENFTVEQIDSATSRDELDLKEQHWIKHYDCISPKGYNLTSGGNTCRFSDETRGKMSNTAKGKVISNETKLKMSVANKGKPNVMKGKHLPDEWKANIRKSQSGENHSFYGKHHSEETKRKISESKKGKVTGLKGENHPFYGKPSPMRGKKMTEEQKAKLRGKRPKIAGNNHPKARKVMCVETGVIYDCAATISVELGFHKNSVGYACRKENRTLGGYHWRFVS